MDPTSIFYCMAVFGVLMITFTSITEHFGVVPALVLLAFSLFLAVHISPLDEEEESVKNESHQTVECITHNNHVYCPRDRD